jgi:hypothetical protein
MKRFGTGLLAGAIAVTTVAGIARASSEDLILQSRLDQTSLSWLIDKTRVLMANASMSDGLSGTVDLSEDPSFGISDLTSDPAFTQVEALMTQVFHVDMAGAVLRVRIPKVSYKVESIHANPKSISVVDPILSMTATAMLSGVDIGLGEGVQLDLMIPNPTTHVLQSYMTASLDPVSVSIPKTLPPATFELSFQTIREQNFHFHLTGFNLDALPVYVHDHQSDLIIKATTTNAAITVNQIRVNPVIVRLGSLTRTLSFDAFKPMVERKLNDVLGQVIFAVGKSLKTTIGPHILSTVFSSQTRSGLEVNNASIFAKYDTVSFGQPAQDQLSFGIAGTLCTHTLYAQYSNSCTEHAEAYTPVREVPETDKVLARNEITEKLQSHAADVVASVSEEYVNRLLKTTIDANLWDSMLIDDHLTLGEKGAFVVFNKATQTPDLFLDLKYSGDGTFLQRMLINARHPIHFPLRISTSLAFESRDGVPFMILKTEKVTSDTDEIIHGIAEYGLSSRLVFGLRQTIAKMILKMAAKLEGKKALEMEIPIFSGLGLEQTSYEVSAYGRVNLNFKLQSGH